MSDRIAVMDQGKVIQVGTPQMVYDEPDDRFVAGFVGVSNLLELEIDEVGEATIQMRTSSDDSISAPRGDGPAPSARRPRW